MKTGERCIVTYGGRTKQAIVELASANGRSLMLRFDGVLGPNGDKGAYLGMMPVLRGDDGVYRELIHQDPITIECEQ